MVTALVGRDKIQQYESETGLNRTFGGSLPQFMAAFLQGRRLSEQEAKELKALIDQHKELSLIHI